MSEIEEWAAALGGEVKGKVEPEGGHYRWTCDICCSTDTHLNRELAGLALYTHIRHGCAQVVEVYIPGAVDT